MQSKWCRNWTSMKCFVYTLRKVTSQLWRGFSLPFLRLERGSRKRGREKEVLYQNDDGISCVTLMWIKRNTRRHPDAAGALCAVDVEYLGIDTVCGVFTFSAERMYSAHSLVIVGARHCLRPGPILIYTRILFGIKLELQSLVYRGHPIKLTFSPVSNVNYIETK